MVGAIHLLLGVATLLAVVSVGRQPARVSLRDAKRRLGAPVHTLADQSAPTARID